MAENQAWQDQTSGPAAGSPLGHRVAPTGFVSGGRLVPVGFCPAGSSQGAFGGYSGPGRAQQHKFATNRRCHENLSCSLGGKPEILGCSQD